MKRQTITVSFETDYERKTVIFTGIEPGKGPDAEAAAQYLTELLEQVVIVPPVKLEEATELN